MNHSSNRAGLPMARSLILAVWIMGSTASVSADTESRTIGDFHSVRFSAPGELTLTRSDTESLEIDAEAKVLERLRTEVVDGVLVIEVAGSEPLRTRLPVRISVGYLNVDTLEVSGSGSLRCDSVRTGSLNLKISGSGRLECAAFEGDTLLTTVAGSGGIFVTQVNAATLAVSLSGSGRASLSGTVGSQTVSLSGSGALRAFDLRSRNATIDVAGSGSARVWVEENLNVTISGSGSVRYRGEPNVRQSIIGSGFVRED